MALPRPSRKSKDVALAGLHNLTRRRPGLAGQPEDVEPDAMTPHAGSQLTESDGEIEAPEPKSAGRGRPPKSAATGETTVSTGGKRGRRGGRTARDASARKKVRTDPGDGEGSLFEIVKSGKTALNTVVDEWIEAYKQDRDAALLELIQFFIHCSGCRGRITPNMYHNMEHADIIRKMTEEFDEDSGDYPLIMTGPAYKKFKSNFCDFIHALVHQCQYSIIYDQYMMDNVISLLTGLTDSQVRAFRHTSTLASMKLMTALVDVALNVSVTLDHVQRQYDSERSKAKGKQASDRLENLLEKRKEAEENQEEIRHMLTYIFKGVFVHRYRDSQAEIRAVCTTEIGVWMKNYPGMFLDDSYLKYIGWTLYDRIGEVRLCCLKCLHPLYDSEELAPKLELFTNRFKDRIVEMTLDKEYDVSVQAVKLVISILKCNPSVLTNKDCENVYELVYSSHRGVAQAAGEFLNAKLFAHELDDATKNLRTLKGKKRSENTSRVRDLIQFFIESELHEHGSYLVDSLWDIGDMLKDWECMTDLLLEEPGPAEEVLDDRHETSLIEVMVCSVKQAATGEYPVGRCPTSRRPTTKEARVVSDDKAKLTEHFIVTLPQLLAKYEVDEEKVSNLLQIPIYFDLEIYVASRQEKNLDLLLKYITNIVEKHTDSEVLENCSKVLEYFVGDAKSIRSRCLTARDTLVDKLVERYRHAMTSFFEEGDEPDDDDAFALMTSLKRLHAFWSCHDLNPWMLWESHSHFLSCTTVQVPADILCKAVACCHLSIIWQLDALDSNSPSKEGMKALQSCLSRFMNACTDMLEKYDDTRQEEAYLCICDLLIIFSHSITQTSPQLEPLVFDAGKELQVRLTHFLNDKVFIEDDDDGMDENKKIEELHKRRNFLASFCKLIVYNIIKIKCATDMFKYYMKFYNDYGDIIKATLGKAREINKVHTAKTLAASLTQLYRELQEEQRVVDHSSESFLSIKELARRFSLSFGLDLVKNREAVAAMHKEGINFVVNSQSYPFLEILCEFSGKLMKQDKKVVLSYLDSRLGSVADSRGEEYAPVAAYRHSLLMGEGDTTVQSTRLAAPTTGGKRRGAKRKLIADGDDTHQGGQRAAASRTPAHDVSHPPVTLSLSKRPHIEHESASEADGASERDYESLSDDERELSPQQRNYVKPKRHEKFSVHQVQAVIESMNLGDAELADDDVVVRGNQAAGPSKDTAADLSEMSPGKKRKLASQERSDVRDRSESSEVENEGDVVEPDEFMSQVKAKLLIIASDPGVRDSDGDDGDQQTCRNKSSLKKAGLNSKDLDSRGRHAASSMGARSLPVWEEKPLAMMSAQDIEDWDRIESLPDSDNDDPSAKPWGLQASDDELKLPVIETSKGRSMTVTPSADRKKRTPVYQVVKPKPAKTMKYCTRSGMLNDSDDEEIAVEEDKSNDDDDTFLSVSRSSPITASPSKNVTDSFWLASPLSKKSLHSTYHEDDDNKDSDADDEFMDLLGD